MENNNQQIGDLVVTKDNTFIKTLECISEDSIYCPYDCQFLNEEKIGIDDNQGRGFCKEILPVGVCCNIKETVPVDYKRNITIVDWIEGNGNMNEFIL